MLKQKDLQQDGNNKNNTSIFVEYAI